MIITHTKHSVSVRYILIRYTRTVTTGLDTRLRILVYYECMFVYAVSSNSSLVYEGGCAAARAVFDSTILQ